MLVKDRSGSDNSTLAYLALYSENLVLLDERRQLMSWVWESLGLDSQLPKQLTAYYVTPCNNVLGNILIYVQQDAMLHCLFYLKIALGWYHHPSSGAQTSISRASGICHTITATCRYSGR
jgi:hypothetical protein